MQVQRGERISPASRGFLLDAMRRSQTGGRRIRAGVPRGTEVADKTGTIGGTTNDVGLVTLPDGTHVALAVFVRNAHEEQRSRGARHGRRRPRRVWVLRRGAGGRGGGAAGQGVQGDVDCALMGGPLPRQAFSLVPRDSGRGIAARRRLARGAGALTRGLRAAPSPASGRGDKRQRLRASRTVRCEGPPPPLA